MTAPSVVAGPNLRANGEITKRKDQFLSPRIVAREAARIVAARGDSISPAALRRLVTRFIRSGYTTLRDLEAFLPPFPDPTGETAARNVDRSRAGGGR